MGKYCVIHSMLRQDATKAMAIYVVKQACGHEHQCMQDL